MAESIEGSFSFNILDNHNNLYLVKGDSPISLIHFKEKGVYVFASTKQILWKALIDSELFQDLENGKYEHIVLNEGDILKIKSNGKRETAHFNYTESYGRHWYDYGCDCYIDTGYDDYYAEEYLEDIKTVAAMHGEDPEVIQELYNDGYTLEELEEMIYT